MQVSRKGQAEAEAAECAHYGTCAVAAREGGVARERRAEDARGVPAAARGSPGRGLDFSYACELVSLSVNLTRDLGTEREQERLEATLLTRRRTVLLLSVLERKETVRIARFRELARLLANVQCVRLPLDSQFEIVN